MPPPRGTVVTEQFYQSTHHSMLRYNSPAPRIAREEHTSELFETSLRTAAALVC